MYQFIELLNRTSSDRVAGYCIVFIIALMIVTSCIVQSVRYIVKAIAKQNID